MSRAESYLAWWIDLQTRVCWDAQERAKRATGLRAAFWKFSAWRSARRLRWFLMLQRGFERVNENR